MGRRLGQGGYACRCPARWAPSTVDEPGPRGPRAKEDTMAVSEQTAPDLEQVKQKQQLMWASGDFHQVAALIQSVADQVAEALDIQAGWRVLDVGTGSGNAALSAARLGAEAVGVDYVPA